MHAALLATGLLLLSSPAPQSSGWKRISMKPLFMSAETLKKPISVPFRLTEGGEEVKVNRWLKWETGSIAILYGYSENHSAQVNLSDAANGALNGLRASKGLKLLKSNQKGVTVSNMVGLKVYAVFDQAGESIVYHALMVAKGKRLWQCVTTYEPTSLNEKIAAKCIGTVTIKP